MNFRKLPLTLAIAATFSGGAAFATGTDQGGDSAEIDKEIVYNQNVSNTGQIATLGLILVDSSAVAVSDVEQSSHANKVTNEFDTRNNASLSDDVLTNATGNIGVNAAAGDNNVQQNSTAIANASSANNSIGLAVDFTAGETNHHDDHSDAKNTSFGGESAQSSESASFGVSGNVDYNHATTERVTVDAWDVHTDSTLQLEGDAVGAAAAASGAETSGMAAWGEYGMGGGSAAGAVFLNDKDVVEPGEGGSEVVVEGHETQGSYTATTSGNAAGSANFTEDQSLSAHVEGFVAAESASSSESASGNTHEDNYAENNSHDDDYRLTVDFDANFVFGGAADAETFSNQTAFLNETINNGVVNSASVGDRVASNASGNIGINVAAGNSNVQANQLAIANNDGVLSTATASSAQSVGGNTTANNSLQVTETKLVRVAMNQTGSAVGTYAGDVDQDGDVYLDTWTSELHSGGSNTGHVDVDSDAQYAKDVLYDDNGNPIAPGGAFTFKEAGTVELSGIRMVGNVVYEDVRYQGHRNNASLGDNALSGASGNIGLNIAAGTNNLQGNALAIANVSIPTTGGGTGGTGE